MSLKGSSQAGGGIREEEEHGHPHARGPASPPARGASSPRGTPCEADARTPAQEPQLSDRTFRSPGFHPVTGKPQGSAGPVRTSQPQSGSGQRRPPFFLQGATVAFEAGRAVPTARTSSSGPPHPRTSPAWPARRAQGPGSGVASCAAAAAAAPPSSPGKRPRCRRWPCRGR